MRAVDDLRRAGATIVDPATVPGLDRIRRPEGTGRCRGFKYDLNEYLAAQGDLVPMKSLADIVKSGLFHPSVRRQLERSEEGSANGPDSPECRADALYRDQLRAAVSQLMDAQKLDALVYPTWSNPPRLIGDLNTPHGDNSQLFSPVTGFPAIADWLIGVAPGDATRLCAVVAAKENRVIQHPRERLKRWPPSA
jgi:Asp-tRNA(Asn)/Glu-tRNA(Gln) amidotransferase A subunit family amidase